MFRNAETVKQKHTGVPRVLFYRCAPPLVFGFYGLETVWTWGFGGVTGKMNLHKK